MARGWIAGLLTGGVVAGLGLAVVSVVFGPVAPQTPPNAMPAQVQGESATDTATPGDGADATAMDASSDVSNGGDTSAAATPDSPETAAAPAESGADDARVEPDPAGAPQIDAPETDDPGTAPEMLDTTAPQTDPSQMDAPEDRQDIAAPGGLDAPQMPGPIDDAETVAMPAEPDEAADLPDGDAMAAPVGDVAAPAPDPVAAAPEMPDVAGSEDGVAEAEGTEVSDDASDAGGDAAAAPVETAEARPPLPQIAAAVAPEPEAAPEPAQEARTEPAPASGPDPKVIVVSPEADLAPQMEAEPRVVTNRLPRIGATEPEDTLAAETPRAPALSRNALAFAPSGDQPRLAFLLIDTGPDGRESLGDLAKLPFPVTVAIDASATDAQAAMAFYRAQGAEVVLEVPLPEGATATDVDVTVEAYAPLLDQAVAVLPEQNVDFQTLGAGAVQLATNLAESGHGLVSYPSGLNTGHKAAIKAGVKAGLVFRDLDAEGQGGAVIRRFLDNAAFKARGEDGVIVVARTRAETVQALLEWSLGTRAQSVALAPVSAVLAGE